MQKAVIAHSLGANYEVLTTDFQGEPRKGDQLIIGGIIYEVTGMIHPEGDEMETLYGDRSVTPHAPAIMVQPSSMSKKEQEEIMEVVYQDRRN